MALLARQPPFVYQVVFWRVGAAEWARSCASRFGVAPGLLRLPVWNGFLRGRSRFSRLGFLALQGGSVSSVTPAVGSIFPQASAPGAHVWLSSAGVYLASQRSIPALGCVEHQGYGSLAAGRSSAGLGSVSSEVVVFAGLPVPAVGSSMPLQGRRVRR